MDRLSDRVELDLACQSTLLGLEESSGSQEASVSITPSGPADLRLAKLTKGHYHILDLPSEITTRSLQKRVLSPEDLFNFSLANKQANELVQLSFLEAPLFKDAQEAHEFLHAPERFHSPALYQLHRAVVWRTAKTGYIPSIAALLKKKAEYDRVQIQSEQLSLGLIDLLDQRTIENLSFSREFEQELPAALAQTQLFEQTDQEKINNLPLAGKLFLASGDTILALTKGTLTGRQALALASLIGKPPDERELRGLVEAGFLDEAQRAILETYPAHKNYLLETEVLQALPRIQPDIGAFLRIPPERLALRVLFITVPADQLPDTVKADMAKSRLLINFPLLNGETKLFGACWEADLETVKALIQHGADVNWLDHAGHSALSWAMMSRNAGTETIISMTIISIIELLLDAGIEIGQPSLFGKSVLHAAAQQEAPEIISLLLDRGAKTFINRPDIVGHTPLYYATIHAHIAVIQRLREHGATLNERDREALRAAVPTVEFRS